VDVMYDRELELAARVNDRGDITATIDNRRVACARLEIDDPPSAFFYNTRTRLRIDLLFDFPTPAADLAARATTMTIRSQKFTIASTPDLLALKQRAAADRSAPGDAEDIAFLLGLLRRP
jgi:hypothetical protein